MLERDLKNYSKYLSSLEKYAKAAKIKILYGEGDFEGGEYNHHTRTMVIDTEEPHKVQIACFLHELGHAFDEALSDPVFTKSLGKAYIRFYAGKHKKYQKRLVVECEIRAWDYGRGLAKLLKIPLGSWYNECNTKFLATYRGRNHENS